MSYLPLLTTSSLRAKATVPPCIPKATTQQSALINNEGSLTLIVYFLYNLDSLGPDESTVEAKIKTLHIY